MDDGACRPSRAHGDDAGIDLRTPSWVRVPRGESYVIDTGVHVELPKGTCGLIVSKSGLHVNHGITTTGLVDCGYQGSILVNLHNGGDEDYEFERGDKIAQLVVLPYVNVDIEAVEAFNTVTERGSDGFGSSGR